MSASQKAVTSMQPFVCLVGSWLTSNTKIIESLVEAELQYFELN
jgi:hypothetical protein